MTIRTNSNRKTSRRVIRHEGGKTVIRKGELSKHCTSLRKIPPVTNPDAEVVRNMSSAASSSPNENARSLVGLRAMKNMADAVHQHPAVQTVEATMQQLYGRLPEARQLAQQVGGLQQALEELRPDQVQKRIVDHYRQVDPRLTQQIQKDLESIFATLQGEDDVAVKLHTVFQKITGLGMPLPEGHTGANVPQQLTTGAALTLTAAVVAQAATHVTSLPDVLFAFAASVAAFLVADFGTGLVHHALDNYGSPDTPIFGGAIKDFQWHHTAPQAESRSGFAASAWRTAAGAIAPLIAALAMDPGVSMGMAVGVAALAAIFATENHKAAHRRPQDVPMLYKIAQLLGLSVGKGHDIHHQNPHSEYYAIINGWTNRLLDQGFIRGLEAVIFKLTGHEPNTWKLDPNLKIASLGAAGFDEAAVRALQAKTALIEEAKGPVTDGVLEKLKAIFPQLAQDEAGRWYFDDDQARNTTDAADVPLLLDPQGRLSFEARRRLMELIPNRDAYVAGEDYPASVNNVWDVFGGVRGS